MNTNTALEKEEVKKTDSPENHNKLVFGTHINETEDRVEIITEVAGYNKENLEITVEAQELKILGKDKKNEENKSRNTIQCEFTTSGYNKVFRISDKIDAENISAEVKDGVLRLTLPKVPRAQKRQIEVKAV